MVIYFVRWQIRTKGVLMQKVDADERPRVYIYTLPM